MEILLPLIAYVGILTGVLWVAARSSANAPIEPNPPRERPKRVYTLGDKVLAVAAQKLGLRHDVDVASGRVGELRVEIAASPDGTSPVSFSGVARFPRSLGLELTVKPRGSLGGRAEEVVVSNDFDHDFAVDALHPDQARDLLGGELEKAMRRGVSRGFAIELDDDALSVSVDANLGAERGVEAMTWLVLTAKAIVEARARLKRPALEQRVLDAFGALAQSLGGRVEDDLLRLELEEGELTAHVDRIAGKQFRTHLSLAFGKPLPLELRLGLEAERSRFSRFRGDLRLGDEPFDETFVVLGEPEEKVKAALDAAMRKRLLDLESRVDALALTPTELEVSVDEALSGRDELGELVDALREIARRLSPQKARGTYR